MLIALPTSEKHNLIWDTDQCQLDYISAGEIDNFPYLRSNGNSLAKVGDKIYSEKPLFKTNAKRQFKGYHKDKDGYPTLQYTIGDAQFIETIYVEDKNIVRSIRSNVALPPVAELAGADQLDIDVAHTSNSITLTYKPH